jgi:hypothetical protein
VDLVAYLRPAIKGSFELELLGNSNGSVEDHPCHDLGVRVVATWSAALPDAVVGLPPDCLDMVDDGSPPRPQPLLDPADDGGSEEGDGDDFAIDVELELFGRCVANPDRR